MKKKFLLTLLAIVCALGCTFGLAACGGKGGGGGNSAGGIYLVRSDGTALSYGASLGECTYMGDDFSNIFDVTVCTKNADGEYVELTENDNVTVTYKFNDEVIDEPTSLSDYNVGLYSVEFSYNGSTTLVYFTVNRSDNVHYTANVSKQSWKYGEVGADLTVDGVTTLSGMYYISEAAYNEIRGASDFDAQLMNKKATYSAERGEPGMTPGAYYLFALCPSTDNYNEAYTDFKKVTVTKGDVTITNAEALNAWAYRYGGENGTVGNIKLSDIEIRSNEGNVNAYAVNGFGETVHGEFVWQSPNTQVNVTHSGNDYAVKFVPEQAYYNEKSAVAQVEITVVKGWVDKPTHTLSEGGYGDTVYYNGEEHKVYTGSSYYDNYVTAKRGGSEKQIEAARNDSILETVTDDGVYSYTLSLKDKVNYYWYDPSPSAINPDDETDTADLTFTYTVRPKESHVGTYGVAPQLVPDNNGIVMLPIAPYITPYKAGTLQAAYDVDAEDKSIHTADVSIVNEGGVDYLKISNIQKVRESGVSGLPIRFTADGDEHYADIDELTYDFAVAFYIYCSIGDIKIHKDTPASVLYDNFMQLTTTVGEYKLQMEYSAGNWIDIGKNAVLPQSGVVYNFRVVFDIDSSEMDSRVEVVDDEVAFTIEGIDFDAPITADARIEIPAGTTVDEALESCEMENAHGHWVIQICDEGYWTSLDGSTPIPEGETNCRIVFQCEGAYIYDTPVIEFTVVGI